MRSRGRSTLLLALSCLAAGCQRVAPLPESDFSALMSDTDRWVKGANAGAWAAVAALYTGDALFMPPNQAMVQGRASIQAWMEAFPKLEQIQITAQQVEGRGDLAYVRGVYAMTIAPQGNAPAMKDNGKYLEIHKKQPDGSWKIALDIFNSDLPATPPEPAKPARPTRR